MRRCLWVALAVVTLACGASAKPVDQRLGNGDVLRVEAVSADIFRIRLSANGRFEPSLMERYGIVRTNWPAQEATVRVEGGVTRISTDAGLLTVRREDGRMQLLDSRGNTVCEEILPQKTRWTETELRAFLKRQASLAEYFKGEKRKQGQIQIVGGLAPEKTSPSESMHEFDLPTNSFGATFSLRDGERFYGLGTASSRRIQLRGHGYRLWTQYRGNFGYEGAGPWEQTEGPVPLLIGTGGWGVFVNTTWVHYYDIGRYEPGRAFFWGPGGSLDFYHPDKFYVPSWMGPDSKGGTFIGGLERTGFKLSLWLVCNDDLTLEEERQVAIREGRGNDVPAAPEAWFDHLRKFIRNGAHCFKMDPENLIQEHPGRPYFNGRTDLENHNLTQILYHKQMCRGFEDFTQQRAMNHYCAAYAGVQHWGATTMGDNGGGRKALVWMLNYAMSGHMNTSCDMDTSPRGMHFGFLQPWSQYDNWGYTRQPWFLGKKNEQICRDYARLRYSLMPYLYSAAHVGHRTSMPILRPMPLAYPDDAKLADNLSQYMLGDSLLVVAFTNHVRLPAGRWIDYWSGQDYAGPREMTCVYPTNRAGGLFIKAGAIIPYWPEMDYVGEMPVETMRIEVYPEGQSGFTLYEDDGNSLEYLKGAVAETAIQCEASKGRVKLTIAPRVGNYAGMPSHRSYDIRIHAAKPESIKLNGSTTAEGSYEAGAVRVAAAEDPARKTPVVVEMESK